MPRRLFLFFKAAVAAVTVNLIGGFGQDTEGEPQTNDAHRCSIDFDGTTNEFLANTTEQDVGIENVFSIAFWVKNDGPATDIGGPVDITPASGNVNRIQPLQRGDLASDPFQVLLYNSSGTNFKDYRYNGLIVSGEWAHIVITWDGTNLTLYKNGVAQTADSTPTDNAGTMTNTDRQVYVGKDKGGNGWNGNIHSVAVWNVELDTDAIKTVYTHGAGAYRKLDSDDGNYDNSSDLLHWWRLAKEIDDLGKDFGSASNLIDIDTNSSGITTADIVRDAPDGGVLDFNGSDELLAKDGANSFGFSSSFTYATWIKFDVLNSGNFVVINEVQDDTTLNDNAISLFLSNGTPNRFRVVVGDDSSNITQITASSFDIQTDVWYHLCIVKDGTSNLILYINGENIVSDNSPIDTSGVDDTNRTLAIAARIGNTLNMDGQQHSLAIWSSALTEAEVQAIYGFGFKDLDLESNSGDYASSGDLIHFWKFGDPNQTGESGDDTVRAKVGSIDLSANAANITHSDDVKVASAVAQGVSVDLDGSNENFANETEQSIGIANAWTISGWVLHDDPATPNDGWLEFSADSSDINAIRIQQRGGIASDPFQVAMWDSSGTLFKNYFWNGLLSASTWAHVTVTWDGTDLKLYKNGVAQTADSTPTDNAGTMTDTNRGTHIGIDNQGLTRRWDGKVGHIAIWNEALTANEAAQIFAGAHSFNPKEAVGAYDSQDNLKHWWKLGEDPDDLGKDYVDSGAIDVDTNSSGITHSADVVGDVA